MGEKSKVLGKLMVFFIIFVFMASLFAVYEFGSSDEEDNETAISVDKYNFTIEKGFYVTEIPINEKQYKVGFISDPRDLLNITIGPGVVDAILSSKKVYVIYDPNTLNRGDIELAYSELSNVLYNLYGKTVLLAYSKDAKPVDETVPLKTCEDATGEVSVVDLSFGSPEVVLKNRCVSVTGKDGVELTKVGSKLAMWLIKVEV